MDNYNGNEYNQYLDQQIIASKFWVDTFLNPNNFKDIEKWIDDYKHKFNVEKPVTEQVIVKQEQKELSRMFGIKNVKNNKKNNKKPKKKINQKGGADSDIEQVSDTDPTDKIVEDILSSDLSSVDSNKEYMTKLKNDFDIDSEEEIKGNMKITDARKTESPIEKYLIFLIELAICSTI